MCLDIRKRNLSNICQMHGEDIRKRNFENKHLSNACVLTFVKEILKKNICEMHVS